MSGIFPKSHTQEQCAHMRYTIGAGARVPSKRCMRWPISAVGRIITIMDKSDYCEDNLEPPLLLFLDVLNTVLLLLTALSDLVVI